MTASPLRREDPVSFDRYTNDDGGDACETVLVFSSDDSILALTAPNRAVATYDVASGRRLGLMSLDAIEHVYLLAAQTVSASMENAPTTGVARASRSALRASASWWRMICVAPILFDLEGERLAGLAPESSTSFAELHQLRGPLGRCPPAGSFVVGETGAFVGYHSGTLARIHRVSDGEVLNLRAIDRPTTIYRMARPTRLLAFSDSGWFDMNSGQPLHLRVRAGASFDAEMASPHENPHRREGLVAAFFSGERLAPAE